MTHAQTINQLFGMLKDKGGAIVSSNDAHEIEIADARATGRFSVDEDGFGFIWCYPEWLKNAMESIRIVRGEGEK